VREGSRAAHATRRVGAPESLKGQSPGPHPSTSEAAVAYSAPSAIGYSNRGSVFRFIRLTETCHGVSFRGGEQP